MSGWKHTQTHTHRHLLSRAYTVDSHYTRPQTPTNKHSQADEQSHTDAWHSSQKLSVHTGLWSVKDVGGLWFLWLSVQCVGAYSVSVTHSACMTSLLSHCADSCSWGALQTPSQSSKCHWLLFQLKWRAFKMNFYTSILYYLQTVINLLQTCNTYLFCTFIYFSFFSVICSICQLWVVLRCQRLVHFWQKQVKPTCVPQLMDNNCCNAKTLWLMLALKNSTNVSGTHK